MAIVTLDDIKEHMRIDFDDDNELIDGKIDAAQAHLESLLGYAIADQFQTPPDDLKEAVRQLVASWYETREATVTTGLMDTPLSVWDVVRERRSYAFE
ncbi:head-tail connector protein [Rhizobium sp. NXC24]|uniref:head-tail connector protein n=1 Tax=Rhizobium sp. NXC24 TaxID=2048897 RepID=UPI000CDF38B8|nr:head-tail connector protein [Rhizobium sp. NXC24]AVA21188.1 phage head-tail connector protein [Rhizobium sp. NXC24]